MMRDAENEPASPAGPPNHHKWHSSHYTRMQACMAHQGRHGNVHPPRISASLTSYTSSAADGIIQHAHFKEYRHSIRKLPNLSVDAGFI
jgi:hypothetical protein